MGFGGGKVSGTLMVDASGQTPTPTRANLQYEGVDLAAFFRGSRFFDTTDGKLKGRIALAGSGRSLAARRRGHGQRCSSAPLDRRSRGTSTSRRAST